MLSTLKQWIQGYTREAHWLFYVYLCMPVLGWILEENSAKVMLYSYFSAVASVLLLRYFHMLKEKYLYIVAFISLFTGVYYGWATYMYLRKINFFSRAPQGIHNVNYWLTYYVLALIVAFILLLPWLLKGRRFLMGYVSVIFMLGASLVGFKIVAYFIILSIAYC